MKGFFSEGCGLMRFWIRLMLVVGIYCSLSGRDSAEGSASGVDLEKQELQVAVATLRKENTELRRLDGIRQRELAIVSNRLTQVEWQQGDSQLGLVADDEEARSVAEWRAFLLNALKVLSDTDRELQSVLGRMRRLLGASQDAFKSAEKVDPAKRARLEAELRESEKMLEKEAAPQSLFVPGPDRTILSAAKVIGVQLDLGVAAVAVGRKHGARVGMPFLVARDKTVLAVLTLVEVREDAALAVIEQMEYKKPIQEGDIATLRKL